MKLLVSSVDLDDLKRVVKRLMWARIPCAVCKDLASLQLSVWVQQDIDFPLALRVSVNRDAPRQLPHWARVFEPALPPIQRPAWAARRGMGPRRGRLVQSQVPTWTGTTGGMPLMWVPQQDLPSGPAPKPLPAADKVRDPAASKVELACPEAT